MSEVPGASQRPDAEAASPAARAGAAARSFLRTLTGAVKLVGLYAPGHPMSAVALKDLAAGFTNVCAALDAAEATLALVEGSWVVNGMNVGGADLCEPLASAFKAHNINSLTVVRGTLSFEFSALCQLVALPPSKHQDLSAADFLRQRGVRHLRLEQAAYQRAKAERAEVPQNPLSEAPPPDVPTASRGFGGFIKGLIDESVTDPAERARIYADTVKNVRRAIEARVTEATRAIDGERREAVAQRQRTENVIAAVSEGHVTVDKDGRVLMMDAAAEQIIGKRLVEVAGKPLLEQVDEGSQMAALSNLAAAEDAGEVKVVADESLMEAYRSSMAVVRDEKGRVVGSYGMLPYVKKLQDAVKMQDEFVASVTHDLKAPLASISASLELINDLTAQKMSDQERKFLDISRRNCQKLRQMIEEVLDFSKIQSGQMSVRPVATGILPIILEAIDALQPWAQNKGLRIEGPSPSLGCRALADHPRVVHILSNLISNAIKFTPAGGTIRVACADGGATLPGRLVVSVSDTGCGIDPDDQKLIFERFSQVGDSRGHGDGVGLGLAIVKQLVERHGGQVWLKSDWGKGSTFYFSLPAASAE